MFKTADRIKESSNTTGTSTLSLAGASPQFRTFVAGIGTTNSSDYCLLDGNGVDFECGNGVVTSGSPDTLSRVTVYSSTNGGAKIVLSANQHTVFCTALANHLAAGLYALAISSPQTNTYAASQIICHHPFPTAVIFPANFGPYNALASQAGGSVNATASTVISVEKALAASPNTFSPIGTITIAAGTVTPTFATAGGTEQSFAQSDVARFVMPVSPDASFVGFYCNMIGHRP